MERMFRMTVMAVLLGSVAAAAAAEKIKVDLSSPKATTATFLKALGAGDIEAAKAASHGTEEHVKYLEAITSMFSGLSRYEAAAAKAFPQDPNSTTMAKGMSEAISGPESLSKIEKGTVTISGATASILPHEDPIPAKAGEPPAPAKTAAEREKETIRLKNVGGQWRLDLDSQFEREEMKRQNPQDMVKFGQAVDALAADIEAGKYKSSMEAQAAFMKVIMEAHETAQTNHNKDAATAAGEKQDGEKPAAKSAPAK